jgi:hypothetical protein
MPIAAALHDLSFDAEKAAFLARYPSDEPRPDLTDRQLAGDRDFHIVAGEAFDAYSGTLAEYSSSGPVYLWV